MGKATQNLMYFNQALSNISTSASTTSTVNTTLSGGVDPDWAIGERSRFFVFFPFTLLLLLLLALFLLQGICRRSTKIFNLVFQIFICFLSFVLFFPEITTSSYSELRILHISGRKKRNAGREDDREGTDWSRCLLLFVSPAVKRDLLAWRGKHQGWGGLFAGAKRQYRFCHLQRGGEKRATQCSCGANGKSANQQHLATNETLTEPKHPANNASLTAADKLS